jgi:hypothetical protein
MNGDNGKGIELKEGSDLLLVLSPTKPTNPLHFTTIPQLLFQVSGLHTSRGNYGGVQSRKITSHTKGHLPVASSLGGYSGETLLPMHGYHPFPSSWSKTKNTCTYTYIDTIHTRCVIWNEIHMYVCTHSKYVIYIYT